jgi:hypothetical protein
VQKLKAIDVYLSLGMAELNQKPREFNNCLKCKIGKMKPTGFKATEWDKEWKEIKGEVGANKCDNCGYPDGGKTLIAVVNEKVGVSGSKAGIDIAEDRKEQSQE